MSEPEVPYRPGKEHGDQHTLLSDVRKAVTSSLDQLDRTLERIEDGQDTLAPEAVKTRRRKIARALRNAANQLDPEQ
jgi:hypothetical protein